MDTNSYRTFARKSLSRFFVSLVAAAMCLLVGDARAQTTFDFTPLGLENSFETATNWNPLGPPGAFDTARFKSTAFAAYAVAFNSSPTNSVLNVNAGDVTFRPLLSGPGTDTYTLTETSTIDGGALTLTGIGDRTFLLNITRIARDLIIGDTATGTLIIFSGEAARISDDVNIGVGPLGNGTVTVDGLNASLEMSATVLTFLRVGENGLGTLNIQNGGSVSGNVGRIGLESNGGGQVTVDGLGSTWVNTDRLDIGGGGHGTLLIQNGGHVSSSFVNIAYSTNGTGLAMVDGGGSTLTTPGRIVIGGVTNSSGTIFFNGGTGTLDIKTGGTVGAGIATIVFTEGQLNLQGGTLSTYSLNDQGGIFNWESGTVNLTNPAGLTLGNGAFEFASETLALNGNQSLDVSGPLTIPNGGGLFMSGGDLTTNGTSVGAGATLFLSGGNHDLGAGLTNNNSVILTDTSINGPVTSPAGSTITVFGDVAFNDLVSGAGGFFGPGTAIFNGGHSPGDSPAVVPVEGNLSYGGGNTLAVELEGLLTGEFDRLEVQGDVFLDGSLTIALLSDFSPSIGDEFEFLDVGGTLSGQFAGLGEGELFELGRGAPLRITYAGGDGNDVVFRAVPEPASLVLAIFALSGVGLVAVRSRGRWSHRA